MMNPKPYIFGWTLKKIVEEFNPTINELPKECVNRMSFLERKKIKDHHQDKEKIKAKRQMLRKKRKSKNK